MEHEVFVHRHRLCLPQTFWEHTSYGITSGGGDCNSISVRSSKLMKKFRKNRGNQRILQILSKIAF